MHTEQFVASYRLSLHPPFSIIYSMQIYEKREKGRERHIYGELKRGEREKERERKRDRETDRQNNS